MATIVKVVEFRRVHLKHARAGRWWSDEEQYWQSPYKILFLCLFGLGNEISLTGRFIDNRNLFLTLVDAGKSKMEATADSVSSEGPLLGSQTAPFHCVLIWQKEQGVSQASFTRA